MNVLIACEKSGVVRRAFDAAGHVAYSCDLAPAEDASKNHYQCDVLEILYERPWDLLIAHPECRYLSNSGVWLLHRGGNRDEERFRLMHEAAKFFNALWKAPIPCVCVENPVHHGYARALIGPYTQTIQPFQFGNPESKRTCLWLRGLPPLVPTNVLPLPQCGHWENQTPSGQNKLGPSPTRSADRARTYEGIARAMASQWSSPNPPCIPPSVAVTVPP